VHKNQPRQDSNQALLARVKKEMDEPRMIHGELLKLGFGISKRTVSLWVKRATRNLDPARRWLAFLCNHRDAIAATVFYCQRGPKILPDEENRYRLLLLGFQMELPANKRLIGE
jgi:hypothetical protein